jgi:hypothetical protein
MALEVKKDAGEGVRRYNADQVARWRFRAEVILGIPVENPS